MRAISAAALRELAADLEMELARLERLEQDIEQVKAEIAADPQRANLFYRLDQRPCCPN